MKTFSTEGVTIYSRVTIILHWQKKKSPLLTHATKGGFDCERRSTDHLHMSVPLFHPAPNTSVLDFCLIEAFSCLQLTQKQQEFIYGQLKLPF